MDFKIKKEDIDNKGRYVILKVEIQKKPYVLTIYYAPNLETEQVSVLNDILRKLTNFEISDDAKIIFGGDFNMILNLKFDADGGNPGLKSNSINVLNKILSENDLIDIWRVRHPEERRFTWRKKTPLLQRRLDYFFLSNILQENIQKVDTLPGILSDHSPVLVQLRNLYEEKHGPSYWKFNNFLFSDTEYVEAMSSELLTILNEQRDEEYDPRKLWEFIKYNVRKFSFQYSRAKSKRMRERRQDLEKRVKFYEDNLLSDSDDGCLQKYHEAKAELDQLYSHITEGIIIRSRTAWYEFGEKSSKYFLGLEKRNKSKTHFKKLLSDDGVTELTDHVDVKTASKALATRVKKVIPKLIAVDQTAYVKGRFTGESIRVINDLIEHIEREGDEGILFSTDIEKAFDSVDHTFLFSALEKFGFGFEFIKWIETLLSNTQSCVMNNGCSTGYFDLERGTRQGDLLSAYLFILVFEILLIQIRQDNEVTGFTVDGSDVKRTCFADDGYFFVKNVTPVEAVLQNFNTMFQFSSLKINLNKCEACWLGRAKNRSTKPIDCKWVCLVSDSIKVLGSHFSYDQDLTNKLNFLSCTINIQQSVKIWNQRTLTIAGRIEVFKSLLFSKLVYISSTNVVPKDIIIELKTIQKSFIWRGRKPKIKHSTLIGDYVDGGLKDIDIEMKFKALKIFWIKRLADNSSNPWKAIANSLLKDIGGTLVFHSNLCLSSDCKEAVKKLPKFYQQLLEFWEPISARSSNEVEFILTQNLWNNSCISNNNGPFFNHLFSKRGINYLHNLFDFQLGCFKSWKKI